MKNILLKEELLAIFRNKKLLIPIIAVLFIPVMYSGMFLWAFWDPYEKLDELPVAIVNDDSGAVLDGEKIKLGEELVDKLKDSKDFNFKFVDKEEGYEDLEHQKYYMLIEIPEDFSENATTLLEENPKKLDLIYVPNEGYNFLSSQIGGTAVERIKASLSEKITETYAETMFDKIGEMADGVTKASEGAREINDGSEKLKSGSKELRDGLATLAEKSIQFNNGMKQADVGVDQLASGSAELSEGIGKLQDGQQQLAEKFGEIQGGTNQLVDGAARINQGLQQIETKLPEAVAGTTELETGAGRVATGLGQVKDGVGDINAGAQSLTKGLEEFRLKGINLTPEQKDAIDELIAGSKKIETGSSELSAATGQLSVGATDLHNGLGTLKYGQLELSKGISQLSEGSVGLQAGLGKLSKGEVEYAAGLQKLGAGLDDAGNGSTKLAQGAAKLAGGMSQLSDGSSAMTDGAGQLADGSEQLSEGTVKLTDGSKELADKLADGAEEASKVDADEKTFNMMADPVKVENEKINEVPNYGTGFAPYFLSLGLFVGALLLSIVFPLREPAITPANGFNWFASKFAILAGIGVIQALLADAILLGMLGLEVQSLPLFLLFSIVTSLTFIALVQFLVTMFGDPGRFIAIIILILQLTTSAGTFPLELVPDFLQGFNTVLPMTYSVHGFKAVISSGDFSFMGENMLILFIFLLAFAVGTLAYFNFKHKRQFETIAE